MGMGVNEGLLLAVEVLPVQVPRLRESICAQDTTCRLIIFTQLLTLTHENHVI